MSRDSGQKKHKKALERAKVVKVKMAKRRAAHDAAKKEEKRLADLERKIAKNERLAAMGQAPRQSSEKLQRLLRQIPKEDKPRTDEERAADIKEKLQHNMEILQALEEEHDAELKYAEEYRRMQEAQALQAQEADRDDPGEPPAEALTQNETPFAAQADQMLADVVNQNQNVPKFKGKFQEASTKTTPGRVYPFNALNDNIQALKRKLKFGGSAECKCVPNTDCQAEQQPGENPQEKVPQGA